MLYIMHVRLTYKCQRELGSASKVRIFCLTHLNSSLVVNRNPLVDIHMGWLEGFNLNVLLEG